MTRRYFRFTGHIRCLEIPEKDFDALAKQYLWSFYRSEAPDYLSFYDTMDDSVVLMMHRRVDPAPGENPFCYYIAEKSSIEWDAASPYDRHKRELRLIFKHKRKAA